MTAGHRGGAGAPLALIHGGGGTWLQWKPTIPLLEGEHDVLAVNMVGHRGGAPAPAGERLGVELLADGVERDLDAAGWTSAHVAGTSLGAWVALELAKRGRARSCTALAPAGGWGPGGDFGLRLVGHGYRFVHAAARLMARDPARWTRRPRLRRLLYWHHFARTDRMDPADTAELIVGVARCDALPAIVEWARHSPGVDGLDAIDCPVQLLFPERDLVLPRRRYGAALTSALPQAAVHDIPGAGHVATWDAPDTVAHLIAKLSSTAA